MNPIRRNKARANNRVPCASIVSLVCAALIACSYGVTYIAVKNGQYRLGESIRETERTLRELRALNQDAQSRIAALSSRMALRDAVASGFVAMVPLQDTAVARLLPPAVASDDGVLRTASANQILRP